MRLKYFIQCLLVKRLWDNKGVFPRGDCLKTVVWLPEKFANSKKIIKLRREDGTWSDGWFVQERYSMQSEEHVLAHERDFAKQRDASDI